MTKYEKEYFKYYPDVPDDIQVQYLDGANTEIREFIFKQLMKVHRNSQPPKTGLTAELTDGHPRVTLMFMFAIVTIFLFVGLFFGK